MIILFLGNRPKQTPQQPLSRHAVRPGTLRPGARSHATFRAKGESLQHSRRMATPQWDGFTPSSICPL